MAFGARVINPIDFKPSTALGISVSFNAPGVFNSTYISKDATKNNLINFFLTEPGERPLNPNFGGGLRAFIFEQIAEDNLYRIENRIETQLKTFFPGINITSLNILRDDDTNTLTVQLKYTVQNTNITDNLELEL